jgi:predicted permease
MSWFGRRDRDLRDEMRAHIDIETQENLARGMPADEARAAAGRTFGNTDSVRERVRAERPTFRLEVLVQDARLALRMMRRNPSFAAAVLVTLALGIGANTAVFSVVYGVLLRPLPYPEPDRLVRIWEEHPGASAAIRGAALSDLTYNVWNESPRTLEGIAAHSTARFTVTGFDEPIRVEGAAVSPSLFPLLRATPAVGRFFRTEEGIGTAAPVVVLSDGFWRERFGGDRAAIGRALVLDDRAYTIIGVAAPGFYFPDRAARVWTPRAVRRRSGPNDGQVSRLQVIARLAPGVTFAQAEAEGTAAARSVGKRPVAADLLFGKGGPVVVHATSVVAEATGDVRPALLVVSVGVGLVLLIACANVANLFLSRGVSRSREIALRAALGAGRLRLVQQLLVESLTLSLAGGLLGLLLGWALIGILPKLAPADFPRLDDVRIDGRVLAFAALASVLAGILSGSAPALRGSRFDVSAMLHGGAWATASGFGGRWNQRMRGALLVAEAALAVMLLVGAGLLVHSFVRLVRVDPGYDAANLLTARVFLPAAGTIPERGGQFVEALLERLRAAPGVVAAGAGNMAPLVDIVYISGFRFPARDGGEPVMAQALKNVITPGYAETYAFRLRQGRMLRQEDATSAIQAMLVNEEFVRQYWPPDRPLIGARFQGLMSEPNVTTEIVGLIANVLGRGLNRQPQPEIYLVKRAGAPLSHISIALRTRGDPAAAAPLLRSLVREVDPAAALEGVGPLAKRVSASVSQPRFAAAVLAAFAGLALSLAAVGLYSVLSYGVSQRRPELGVRAALGATRADLMRLVAVQGLGLTAVGLALGLAGAAALTRLMTRVLFGVAPLDAVAFGAAALTLFCVAAAACLIPARRAAAADPAAALRSE